MSNVETHLQLDVGISLYFPDQVTTRAKIPHRPILRYIEARERDLRLLIPITPSRAHVPPSKTNNIPNSTHALLPGLTHLPHTHRQLIANCLKTQVHWASHPSAPTSVLARSKPTLSTTNTSDFSAGSCSHTHTHTNPDQTPTSHI